MTSRALTGAILAAALVIAGCEDQAVHRRIQIELSALVRSQDDSRLATAQQRLLGFGVAALPQIETALHAAPEQGRLRIVAVLGALGHPESVPILRHLTVYDASAKVRSASQTILEAWTTRPGEPGEKARAALGRITELRSTGPAP